MAPLIYVAVVYISDFNNVYKKVLILICRTAEHLFIFKNWNETRKSSIKKRVSITAMEV